MRVLRTGIAVEDVEVADLHGPVPNLSGGNRLLGGGGLNQDAGQRGGCEQKAKKPGRRHDVLAVKVLRRTLGARCPRHLNGG